MLLKNGHRNEVFSFMIRSSGFKGYQRKSNILRGNDGLPIQAKNNYSLHSRFYPGGRTYFNNSEGFIVSIGSHPWKSGSVIRIHGYPGRW